MVIINISITTTTTTIIIIIVIIIVRIIMLASPVVLSRRGFESCCNYLNASGLSVLRCTACNKVSSPGELLLVIAQADPALEHHVACHGWWFCHTSLKRDCSKVVRVTVPTFWHNRCRLVAAGLREQTDPCCRRGAIVRINDGPLVLWFCAMRGLVWRLLLLQLRKLLETAGLVV